MWERMYTNLLYSGECVHEKYSAERLNHMAVCVTLIAPGFWINAPNSLLLLRKVFGSVIKIMMMRLIISLTRSIENQRTHKEELAHTHASLCVCMCVLHFSTHSIMVKSAWRMSVPIIFCAFSNNAANIYNCLYPPLLSIISSWNDSMATNRKEARAE